MKGAIAAGLRENIWPLIEVGKIKPVIHAQVPLDQAPEAHRYLEDGNHIGKVVLTL